MTDVKRVKVDGQDFELRYLPPKQSIRVLVGLLKMIAAPAARGLKGIDAANSLMDGDLDFSKIVDGLVANITADGVIDLIEEILTSVSIKATEGYADVTLEATFQARMPLLFNVVKEAIVFNYADILKKNLGGVLKRREAEKPASA